MSSQSRNLATCWLLPRTWASQGSRLSERRDASLRQGIVFVERHEHADPPHAVRALQAAYQQAFIQWLAQKANSSGAHCAGSELLVRETRNENDGDAVAFGDEPALQSRPDRPGICKSVMRHEVSARHAASRNRSADSKVAASYPSDSIRSRSDSLTKSSSSSSTIEIMGLGQCDGRSYIGFHIVYGLRPPTRR